MFSTVSKLMTTESLYTFWTGKGIKSSCGNRYKMDYLESVECILLPTKLTVNKERLYSSSVAFI